MFEKLKENIQQEKKIITDIISINSSLQTDLSNKSFYTQSIDALATQLNILNDSTPELLNEWKTKEEKTEDKKTKKEQPKNNNLVRIEKSKIGRGESDTKEQTSKNYITINKEDKKEFMKKLKLSEGALSNIVKEKQTTKQVSGNSKPSQYVILSNKLFRKTSDKLSKEFESLGKDLKKANMKFMLSSYISMMIMSTILAFIFGTIIFAIAMIINTSNLIYIIAPFALSGITLFFFYIYPSSEAKSSQKKISGELPFATIHMAAIAGSNIEPVKIFKIIASSSEYPNVGAELKKVVSQVEIYGYDLVMALKNVAARTSNKDLAEVFGGIATNISTGGALKNYLEKKSETFLNDYKLERKKYADLAATFMDVYISILIAAPLILMMMGIVMNVAGLGLGGLSITALLMISVAIIIVVNIIFIFVLNAKQPTV